MKYLILVLLLSACGSYVCAEKGIVEEVGGCNKSGWCGVRTTQGKFSEARLPVKGEEICIRSEWK